jgi:hypothetical protein
MQIREQIVENFMTLAPGKSRRIPLSSLRAEFLVEIDHGRMQLYCGGPSWPPPHPNQA